MLVGALPLVIQLKQLGFGEAFTKTQLLTRWATREVGLS
jgi:hypothetical protein